MGERGTARRIGRPPRETIGEGERRAQIMRAGLDLFGSRGYAAVSLGEIATTIGVTKAALYHHFPSKDELYTAVMCDLLHRIAASIGQIAALDLPIEIKIRRLIERPLHYLRQRMSMDAMLRDVHEQLDAAQRERILVAHRAMDEALLALLRDGVATGALRDADPRLIAHAFRRLLTSFGGEEGLAIEPDQVATMIDLFLHGILATPGRGAATDSS